MYVYIEQGTLVVDGRRTFDLIDVELSRRCTGRVDSSVQRVEDLLVVPSCQLLGAIIRKTHGEELYIIDKFPKDLRLKSLKQASRLFSSVYCDVPAAVWAPFGGSETLLHHAGPSRREVDQRLRCQRPRFQRPGRGFRGLKSILSCPGLSSRRGDHLGCWVLRSAGLQKSQLHRPSHSR